VATLTIKNVPEELRQRLEESAAQHRRSVSAEAIFCLEKVLVSNRVDPDDFLAWARAVRARMPRVFVTQRDLQAAPKDGPWKICALRSVPLKRTALRASRSSGGLGGTVQEAFSPQQCAIRKRSLYTGS
jgi:plasmid stability protein